MIVFFNLLGVAWTIVGLGAAIGLQNAKVFVTEQGDRFILVACGVIILVDLLYRAFVSRKKMAGVDGDAGTMKASVATHWVFGPSMGGSLMLIPAWATAALVYLAGALLM